MKKLFTIDDFMVAFISALGYGFGYTIPMHLGWPELACLVACFALGIALEEIISKIVFSKTVQQKTVNRVFTYVAILLVFLIAEFVSTRLLGTSLMEDLEEEFAWVVGLPILGLVVNLLIRGYRVRKIRKHYGDGSQGYTYADGKLIWTYTDEGGEHTSTFVKLTADERAAYEALGVGTIVETEEDFVEQGEDRVQEDSAGDTLYQVALLQSLVQGYYDGIITVGELKQHGDTGIGTFEGVNGEMIVLDGVVYQAISDGSIAIPADEETVPFSNVTFFDVDETLALSGIADMAALQEAMNGVVSELGANCFYMVKIDGTFESIKVRSEYKQEKPYRMLDEALAEDQTEFDYQDICGTMVGLYCPDYMGGLNSVGWHFHFINEDRTRGGHVLQVSVAEAEASFDMTDGFEMTLSRNAVFQDMALAKDVDEAIHRAETATTGKN